MNTLGSVHRAMTFLLLTSALLLVSTGPAAGQLAQTPWPMFPHVDRNHVQQDRANADRHGLQAGRRKCWVLLGTGTGSTQQYRADKFAAQVQ